MNENLESEKTFLKLNNASSNSGSQEPPMDDASLSPDQGIMGDPNAMGGGPNAMGGDPGMMGDDQNAMGEDPNAMGEDPNAMGGDPGMMGDDQNAMGEDPNAMGEDPNAMGGEGTGDDTMSIINQLSDTDREAVRAYAESMLNRDETQGEGGGEPADGGDDLPIDANGQPMMEKVIFTKNQLRMINEELGLNSQPKDKDEKNQKPLQKKTSNTTSKKSPFNPPRFK